MGVRRDGLLLMLALWLELARCFLFDLTLRTFVEFILPRASACGRQGALCLLQKHGA